jgi:diguanylate cyclase (GGDEF)-like protein
MLGCALAIVVPAGLIAARRLVSPKTEFVGDLVTYGYLFLSLLAIVIVFGRSLGSLIDRLSTNSSTDWLTGLPNRGHFAGRLGEETTRATRYSTPLSLLMLDVDRLKRINDEHGHAAGDEALVTVAECIRKNLRTTDVGARYGGDEFAVLLPHTASGDAMALASRIRRSLKRCTMRKGPFLLSISVGVAELKRGSAGSANAMVESSDSALYRAKAEGGDRTIDANWVRPRLRVALPDPGTA